MHIGLVNSPQTKNTLILSSISAIICGIPLFEWILWIPGAIFGILFAIANFNQKWQIGLYTALSSVIYIGAVRLFFAVAGNDLDHYWVGGFLAGAVGALALALLTKLIGKTPLAFLNEFRTTLIGGITGVAFVQIFISALGNAFSNNTNISWVLILIAWAVWQVPVGWLLTTSIQSNSNPSKEPSTNAIDQSPAEKTAQHSIPGDHRDNAPVKAAGAGPVRG
jgi:hypothetical protein